MCVSSGEHSEDVRLMRGPVTKLIELVKQFGREYSAEKDKMNSADFSDILHRALNLLAVSDGRGGYIKTDLARELSSHYVEILVDEYQDINEAQDMIFKAISADENNLLPSAMSSRAYTDSVRRCRRYSCAAAAQHTASRAENTHLA